MWNTLSKIYITEDIFNGTIVSNWYIMKFSNNFFITIKFESYTNVVFDTQARGWYASGTFTYELPFNANHVSVSSSASNGIMAINSWVDGNLFYINYGRLWKDSDSFQARIMIMGFIS